MDNSYTKRPWKMMKNSYVSKLITCAMSIMSALCVLPCSAQKKQHGKASFYSKRSTGARTASGQRLHHDSLTCAHRYYPFGTRLKVTNLSNNKSVIVKVIDRGPFGRGRIIDLSWAAAKAIGMIAQGVASVKIETVENPIPYRPEENKLPHVDFEVANGIFSSSTNCHFCHGWPLWTILVRSGNCVHHIDGCCRLSRITRISSEKEMSRLRKFSLSMIGLRLYKSWMRSR